METILGNRSLLNSLLGAIKSGKLAGCYIIEGAKGTGKFTVARFVASILMCKNPREDHTPCGTCHGCRNVAEGNHIDVVELKTPEDKKQISVEAVRKMLECTHFLPAEGDWRVFIIQDAENLNKSAQNALLKSIEEPRPNTVFFLLTSDSSKLLPTVRSRGVKLRCEPLSKAVVAKKLESEGASPEEAAEAALLCGGSLGKARMLLSDTALKKAREKVMQYFSALLEGASFTRLCLIIPPAATNRKDLEQIFSLVKMGLRDLMGTRFGTVTPEFFSDETLMRDLSDVLSPAAGAKLFSMTEDLEKALGQNVNVFSALSGFHLTAMKLTRS